MSGAAPQPAPINETREERKARLDALNQAARKKRKSVPILIMESDLYDKKPAMQMTLMVIALAARSSDPDKKHVVPEDMPQEYKDDIAGWCDMAQWRIALRAKKSRSQVQRDLETMHNDGVIEVRTWEDSNNARHNMYKVNVEVLRERQRKQTPNVERPSRYKDKAPTRGRFTSKNQPKKSGDKGVTRNPIAEMDEE